CRSAGIFGCNRNHRGTPIDNRRVTGSSPVGGAQSFRPRPATVRSPHEIVLGAIPNRLVTDTRRGVTDTRQRCAVVVTARYHPGASLTWPDRPLSSGASKKVGRQPPGRRPRRGPRAV